MAGGQRRVIARLFLLAAILAWPARSMACTVRALATIPLDLAGTIVLAPVTVNGIQGSFILDTGASFTTVTPDAVARFNLELDEWTATTMRGIGGLERRRNANPRSVTLGGIPLARRSVARDSTLRVATLPHGGGGPRIDGLLGRDFLSAFDLALDLRNRTLTIHDVRDCSGRFLPWTEDYVSVSVENPAGTALVVPVRLDGVPLRALLDSGASQTLVAAPGMARLHLGLDRLDGDPRQTGTGLGPHAVTMWRHRFDSFVVGTDQLSAPVFLVAPVQLAPVSDMLLGADWLSRHKVWISYATRALFVAR